MLGEQAYGILNTAVNGRIKNAHVLGVLVARTEDLDRSELPEAISLVGQAVAKRPQPARRAARQQAAVELLGAHAGAQRTGTDVGGRANQAD